MTAIDRTIERYRKEVVAQNSDRRFFFATKRTVDLVMSFLLVPVLVIVAFALVLANPFFNRGPLFYTQVRMGRECRPFRAYKFRSMLACDGHQRGHDDPIESHRIRPLGLFLRQTRLDELPQILNVFSGDMSLIGPRPDSFSHAKVFCRTIPGYVDRYLMRPGISGHAQVTQGYAVGTEATRRKTELDLEYIQKAGIRMDACIFVKTIAAVLFRRGS